MKKRISLADVRATTSQSAQDPFVVKYFARPIAFRLTPYFYNSGWSPNGMTYLCFLLSTASLLLLLFAGNVTCVVASVLFYTMAVLDCVDGNLARVSNAASYYGKFIDGVADVIFPFLSPFCAGLGLFLAGESACWMIAGAILSVSTLSTHYVRSRYSFFRTWLILETGPITPDETSRLAGPVASEERATNIYVNTSLLTPLFLFIPFIGLKIYLVATLLLLPLSNVWLVIAIFKQATITLIRWRRSRHATS